jgi:hypothetical protein
VTSRIQVTESNYEAVLAWAREAVRTRDIAGVWIKFPQRDRLVVFGEWIVRNPDGSLSIEAPGSGAVLLK